MVSAGSSAPERSRIPSMNERPSPASFSTALQCSSTSSSRALSISTRCPGSKQGRRWQRESLGAPIGEPLAIKDHVDREIQQARRSPTRRPACLRLEPLDFAVGWAGPSSTESGTRTTMPLD